MRLTYAQIIGTSYAELSQLCIRLLAVDISIFVVEEEPELWLRVVNDTQVDPHIRTLCLIQFFLRHAFGRKVVDVLQIPGISAWFNEEKAVFPVYKGGMTIATTKGMEFVLVPRISADNPSSLDLSVLPNISEDKFPLIFDQHHCPSDLVFTGVAM